MGKADAQQSFVDLMQLREEASDVWAGMSPLYPWGRVYGGLVVAQGLRAAYATVAAAYRIHSLHAYFIRSGTHEEPIRYEVDRVRDGRSFATRRVLARQSSGTILNLSASFQIDERDVAVQLAELPSALPEPKACPRSQWTPHLETRIIPALTERSGRAAAWIRIADCPTDDPILQDCGIAYASDELPMIAAMRAHPGRPDSLDAEPSDFFYCASLDHALWFHRAGRADQWMLHDVECHGLGSARGLTLARLFARDGAHFATLAQECLIRSPQADVPQR